MTTRFKNILLGIADALFPSIGNSVQRDAAGKVEINYARLVSAVLVWLCFIAVLRGWLSFSQAVQFIQTLFTGTGPADTYPAP